MDGYEDDPGGTGSSIAAPLIRALLAAAIGFGVYWLVFAPGDMGDELTLGPTAEPTVTAVATVPPSPVVATPTPTTPVLGATPTATPTAGGDQIGAGLSIQVLNGTDDAELLADAISLLRDLGYDVTDSGRAANDYAETTLFATAGQEAAAQALEAAEPRITTIGENPGNLTTEIDLHLVVGEDWTTAGGAGDTATEGEPTEAGTEG